MPNSIVYNANRQEPSGTYFLTPTSPSTAVEPKGAAATTRRFGEYINRVLQKAGVAAVNMPDTGTPAPVQEPVVSHPYYPLATKMHDYVENDQPVWRVVVTFASTLAVVLGTTWIAIHRWRPAITTRDRVIVLWFTLAGCLHTLFEGYFVYNHDRLPGRLDTVGQLWKEYALSDSRYLTGDTFVLAIETITVLLWGPLSFFTAYLVAASRPLRHVFQIIVSVAHIYGCGLYFATATVDSYLRGIEHSRPEFLYLWVYYFGLNVIFIVIPSSKLTSFWASTTGLTELQYCCTKAPPKSDKLLRLSKE